jgi:outer membrane protein OmpA-like peptidoglycan-associated protein
MNEFEQLGTLLLGEEKTRIDRLEMRLNDTQQRCQDIVTILPAALRAMSEADLISSLQIPVESCLKKSVQNDPHSFVKAILPIEKPLMRKIVAEAIKPIIVNVQAETRKLKEIKESLAQFEQNKINQEKQLSNLVEQFDRIKNENINQINSLKLNLETQLNDLETYFDKLEKAQVNQHLQLGNLNEHFDSRVEKVQAEQKTQYLSTHHIVKNAIQKFKVQINDVNKQVNTLEQSKVDPLRSQADRFEKIMDRYEQLENRINKPSQRAREISEILPEAIRHASQETKLIEQRLVNSLQKPVEICLKESIRQDTNALAQSLFPVIGPMIRKAINESFKVLLQQINTSLENVFSFQRLTWRIQALYSGRSYSEIVITNTFVYRVEQVFLIHRESGLLIHHTHIEGIEIGDSDAVSAMFTAIQDFIRDSFSANKKEELDSVEIGNYTVWIERGPYVVLACVIRGIAPLSLRKNMSQLLEEMHGNYGELLEKFEGDNTELQHCLPLLENTLQSEVKPSAAPRLHSPKLFIIFALILLFASIWGYSSFSYQQRLSNYINALRDTPGIVVYSTEKKDGKLVIHGLRDPLAEVPQEIALRFELDDVVFKEKSYHDLNRIFVEKRLEMWLNPPKTVEMSLKGGILHLRGYAEQTWIDKTINNITLVSMFEFFEEKTQTSKGVNQLEINELISTDQFLLAKAKRELTPPDNIILTVHERTLKIKGDVDSNTFQALQQSLQQFQASEKELSGIETSELINVELEIRKLTEQIEKTFIYFAEGDTEFMPRQKEIRQKLHKAVQKLFAFSQDLHQSIRLEIIGDTDGMGSEAYNRQLGLKRAEIIRNGLKAYGIKKHNMIITLPPKIRFGETEQTPHYRNVSFRVRR